VTVKFPQPQRAVRSGASFASSIELSISGVSLEHLAKRPSLSVFSRARSLWPLHENPILACAAG
jgi:hypothetical protein